MKSTINNASKPPKYLTSSWSIDGKIHRNIGGLEQPEDKKESVGSRVKKSWPIDGRINPNKLLTENTKIVRSDAEKVCLSGLSKGSSQKSMMPQKNDMIRSFSNVNSLKAPISRYSQRHENYVYIKDPVVKDLTIALINSEKDRQTNKINSNKLTLIELGHHSILFSKKGSDSITNRKYSSSTDLFQPPPADPTFNPAPVLDNGMTTLSNASELYSNKNLLLTSSNCNYYLMEIFNETTGVCNDKPKTNDLTTETRRTVLSDLRENPIEENGARSYKIFVYGNGINIRYKEQTLRILVSRVSRDRIGRPVPLFIGGNDRDITRGLLARHTNATYKFLDLDEII